MLINPNKILSFDEHLTKIKRLEEDQKSLIKACEEATKNIQEALIIIASLRKLLLPYMSEAEINRHLDGLPPAQ